LARKRLDALTDTMLDGVITREEYQRRRPEFELAMDRAKRAVSQTLIEARPVDGDATEVNRYLRGVFEAFELDDAYQKATAIFVRPELASTYLEADARLHGGAEEADA
jgi:hypothetical protein